MENEEDFRNDVFGAATNFTTNEGINSLTAESINELVEGTTKGVINVGGEPFKVSSATNAFPPDLAVEVSNALGGGDKKVPMAVMQKLNESGGVESPHVIVLGGPNKGKILSREEGGKLHVSSMDEFLELMPTFLTGEELKAFDEQFKIDAAKNENAASTEANKKKVKKARFIASFFL